jgi:hypothetical protein
VDGFVIGREANGVDIRAPGSLVFGAKGAGVAFVGGSIGTTLSGVQVSACGGDGIRIGVGDYTGSVIRATLVSGNSGAGVGLNGLVRGISLGAANDGITVVGNGSGIEMRGGSQDVSVVSSRISGNYGTGISITGSQSARVLVQDSLIGLDAPGTGAMGNAAHGVYIAGASEVTLSGSKIAGNSLFGVIVAAGATGTRIDRCDVGLLGGMAIDGGVAGKVGNGQSGVWILGPSPGTVITASTFAANGNSGIQLSDGAKSSILGGSGTDANIVRDNAAFGITCSGDVAGSRVIGSFITGNAQYGMYINNARGLEVGGASPGEGNTIGLSVQGVVIGGDLTNTRLRSNVVSGNPAGGIVMLEAMNLSVGGGNRVVQNTSYGIFALGVSTGSTIFGNELSGQSVGIWLHQASGISIGSKDGLRGAPDPDANSIVDNAAIGVNVGAGAIGNSILSNVIAGNGVFGIMAPLSSSATTPAPVSVSLTNGSGRNDTVSFRMPAGTPAGVYRVQVFRTSASRVGGGQGEVLVATRDCAVSGASLSFSIDKLSGIMIGERVTLAATRVDGGQAKATSAFSAAVIAR